MKWLDQAIRRPRTVLACAVLLALGTALFGGFVWDDRPLISDNRLVRSLDGVGELVRSSFWETGDGFDRFRAFYRPVVTLSFAGDRALWGDRPFGFHLTNLLVHLLCCLLVLDLARREGLPPGAALAGAALFAVHPVHVESVAWISGRTDLLCALGVLTAFCLHRRAIDGGGAPVRLAGALVLGLALFAKEMAATLPLLVAADCWWSPGSARRRLRSMLAATAPLLVVLAGYLVVRRQVLGAGAAPLFELDPLAHFATAAFVLARYLTLLLLPFGLDAHYPYDAAASFGDPRALLGAAMLVVAVIGITLVTRGRPRARFWAAWIPITLAPVMAFGRFGDVLMADRFLYIPSVGLAVLAAHGVAGVARRTDPARRRALAAATALAVLALGTSSALRARVWRDDLTLFTDMVRTSPDSSMVRNNMGLALYDAGRVEPAVEEFRRAVELTPGFALALNNLAAALDRQGRREDALERYLEAIAAAPQMIEARANAGHLLVRLGRVDEGLGRLRRLVAERPRSTAARYALASALDVAGRGDEALAQTERLLDRDADYAQAWYLRGKLLAERGDEAGAVLAMRRFLALWPTEDAYSSAARSLVRGGAGTAAAGGAPDA